MTPTDPADSHRLSRAADVCRLFRLSPAARELFSSDLSPRAFFDRLVAADHLTDARRLLAHGLRPEASVWWAAMCLHHSGGHKPLGGPAEEWAFDAVGRWSAGPTEAARRAAEKAGWAARPTTAAGILALAVFLSGGSISRPNLPAVMPKVHLCGRLCGVVVYLASVRFEPTEYMAHLRQYLQIGLSVARGENPPPALVPDAPLSEPARRPVPIGIDRLPAEYQGVFRSGPLALESTPGERFFEADPPPDQGPTP